MQITRSNADQYIVEPPQDQYCDFNRVYVPSLYVVCSKAGWQVITVEEEATDREVLRYLEKSEHFDFLNNPEEDIYGLSDGEPV
jgi:hypothetical protein